MKRFPDMAKEKFCILSVLVMTVAVSHSSSIFRPPKEDSSENAGNDREFESNSEWDPPHLGVPDLENNRFQNPSFVEYDDNTNEIDHSISGGEPDSFIPDLDNDELPYDYYEGNGEDIDGNVADYHSLEETPEGGIDKPFVGEDDLTESLGGKGDPEDLVPGGKGDPEDPVPGGKGEEVDEDKIDNNKTGGGVEEALENKRGFEGDLFKPWFGRGGFKLGFGSGRFKPGFESDLFKPGFGGGGFFGGKETEPGFLGEGSIFDNPFFNLEKVRRYFHQMEKALEHVFKETVDEAVLLNGTYANTTEQEVDINGKKYIILKSILKGRDNHTSIYVETLSSKPKEGEGEEAHTKKE